MRIFLIWNRAYKATCVLAPDIDEALKIALGASHFRRAGNYRRWDDCTEEYLASDDYPKIEELLALGITGILTPKDGGWNVNGKPVPL